MKRKVVLTGILFSALIVSLFSLTQVVEIAKANFIPPPTPNTDPPTLAIQSPQNSTTYTDSNVTLIFSLTKPDTWFNNTQITRIEYTLDENRNSILFSNEVFQAKMPNGDNLQKVTYFQFSLENLSNGAHSLDIHVKAESLYTAQSNYPTASMEVYSKVFFSMEKPVFSSPSPSIPEFPAWIILPTLLIIATLVTGTVKKRTIIKIYRVLSFGKNVFPRSAVLQSRFLISSALKLSFLKRPLCFSHREMLCI